MLKRIAICLLIAAAVVWFIEMYGEPISHSSVGVALLLLACPGMIPGFFGLIGDVHVAWTVATLFTACYYVLIWRVWRHLLKRVRP